MDKLKKNKVIVAVVILGLIIIGLLIAILAQTHQNKVSDNGTVTASSQKHGYMTSAEKQSSMDESSSIKEDQDNDKQRNKYIKMAKGDTRHVILLSDTEGKFGTKNASVAFYTTWSEQKCKDWTDNYSKSLTKSEYGPKLTNEERLQSPDFLNSETFGTKYTFKNIPLKENDGFSFDEYADKYITWYSTVSDYVKSDEVNGMNPKDIK